MTVVIYMNIYEQNSVMNVVYVKIVYAMHDQSMYINLTTSVEKDIEHI